MLFFISGQSSEPGSLSRKRASGNLSIKTAP
jgi:hypothetical protein